jgi:hypothetical protein
MAKEQPVARKESRPKRDKQQDADSGKDQNGREDAVARYEQELAGYLQERIKPGLNSGAIPLLARSIAKEIAHREPPDGGPREAAEDDEPSAEGEEPSAKTDDEPSAEADEEAGADADDEQEDDEQEAEGESPADFEADMHELQSELGEDWILRFSVQGDDAWLTAEKDDGSQRVEAPTAAVLSEVVGLLNEGGGRSD